MGRAEKWDADAIRAYLKQRDASLLIPPDPRTWWKRFAFHFTDVHNAVGLLTHERIYSRRDATSLGLMVTENADTTVVAQASHLANGAARFYFRPRTPTQFRNEGVRPAGDRFSNNAHCPVPVFFIVPLPDVLVVDGARFTNGGANWSEVIVGERASDLATLNWQGIYSHGSMGSDRDRKILLTFLRRAEILVPDHFDLDLERCEVVCRSPAERETLLYLLPEAIRDRWRAKVKQPGPQLPWLFEASWIYMESVSWGTDKLIFKFHPYAAELPIHVHVRDMDRNEIVFDKERMWPFAKSTALVAVPPKARRIEAKVWVDGCLVYANEIQRENLLAPS